MLALRPFNLLPHLERRFRVELAHALTHLSLIAVLQRVTGTRWAPAEGAREGGAPLEEVAS